MPADRVQTLAAAPPSLKPALLHSVSPHRTILAAAMTALLPAAQALAAPCAPGPGAAVGIASGSCEDADPGGTTTRSSAGPGAVIGASGTGTYTGDLVELNATGTANGAQAGNGGTILLTGRPDINGAYPGVENYSRVGTDAGIGLYAGAGGRITADHTLITTNDAGAHGIMASGAGAIVALTGSPSADTTNALYVTTDGSQAHGVYAVSGGTITLTNVDVATHGEGSSAFYAGAGGSVIVNASNAFVGSPYEPGIAAAGAQVVGAGSSLLLNGSFVNTYADDSTGLFVTDTGTAILRNGGAVVTGNYYGPLINNSPAMRALGAGSRIQAEAGVSVSTYGATSPGVWADAGARIDFAGAGTFTYQSRSPGAQASGGGTVTLTDTISRTSGPASAGVLARDGGTVMVTGSEVTTGYLTDFPPLVLDYQAAERGQEAHGAEVAGPGSRLQAGNADITTIGNGAIGVLARDGGTATVTGGSITTLGASTANFAADGARATGADSSITLTDTTVRTVGPASDGLRVTGGGAILVTGTEITTGYYPYYGNSGGSTGPSYTLAEAGQEAHAAEVAGPGSLLQAGNARITTTGAGAIGVLVAGGGTAFVTGGTIWTEGGGTAAFTADGVRATGAGSGITLTGGTAVTTWGIGAVGLRALDGGGIAATGATVVTHGRNAFGAQAGNAGGMRISGGSVTTDGAAAHGLAGVDGGTIAATGTTVAVSGAGSAAIYLAGGAPSTISVRGGSLSAAGGALVLAEGGTGTVTIGGGTTLTPAVVDGRLLLARATEDAAGNPARLTLAISGMPALAGDVVVDPSALTYTLSNSAWTGNLVLAGPGNTAAAGLAASQWTGDLLADAGNTADVALAQGSLWTGLARNATDVAIDAGSAWAVTGDSNATGTVTNAGLIRFLARSDAYTTLTTGSYAGNGGRIGFNTWLGDDTSPSNLLEVHGGTATGSTTVLVANTGGSGALTAGDGIRLVQVTGGGTTAAGAFRLGQRVAAGAFEYLLFRGGGSSADDWFLRSTLIAAPSAPSGPAGPPPGAPAIPLYRPEVALYAPIPAIARQMGLATLGTLHERVGEEENIRALTGRGHANGGWARAIGERARNRWGGTVDTRATADLVGLQAGFDIIRTNPYAGGHRDHLGVYVAYTDYDAPSVSGFALGIRTLRVGRLSLEGPSAGAYWTHFGPSGWYLDAVFQASWYDVTARSDYGTGLSTHATGYTASLEAGYPIRFGQGGAWQIEPQAQILYQSIAVDRARDAYSGVDWDEGDAWTGRLGARLHYTGQDEQGTLWQPYARINLWHAFSGKDGARFGRSSPTIETRFGDTALEAGGGVTARVNRNLSFYGQASYRWSLDGGRGRQTAVAGTIGIRVNW